MAARDLNDIKQKTDWHPIMLEVHRDSHIRLVIRRRPGVGAKTQGTVMFLVSLLDNPEIQTKILTCKSLATRFFIFLKTCFTSRATVIRFGNL